MTMIRIPDSVRKEHCVNCPHRIKGCEEIVIKPYGKYTFHELWLLLKNAYSEYRRHNEIIIDTPTERMVFTKYNDFEYLVHIYLFDETYKTGNPLFVYKLEWESSYIKGRIFKASTHEKNIGKAAAESSFDDLNTSHNKQMTQLIDYSKTAIDYLSNKEYC